MNMDGPKPCNSILFLKLAKGCSVSHRDGNSAWMTDREGLSDLVCTGLFEHFGVGVSVKGHVKNNESNPDINWILDFSCFTTIMSCHTFASLFLM